jgi:hypothetical protein
MAKYVGITVSERKKENFRQIVTTQQLAGYKAQNAANEKNGMHPDDLRQFISTWEDVPDNINSQEINDFIATGKMPARRKEINSPSDPAIVESTNATKPKK